VAPVAQVLRAEHRRVSAMLAEETEESITPGSP
jgi:hypothetical protein